jgi:hypothetical protein
MLRSSPSNLKFLLDNLTREKERGQLTDEDFNLRVKYFTNEEANTVQRESDPLWAENNLEYDLRTVDWVAEKCLDRVYAQNLYAALCNNEFIKNEVWTILLDKSWSCSWRYAGGIVANIRQEGDYIDWYCTGSNYDPLDQEELDHLNLDELMRYKESQAYVGEGCITDEIRQDLFKLGWVVYAETK